MIRRDNAKNAKSTGEVLYNVNEGSKFSKKIFIVLFNYFHPKLVKND